MIASILGSIISLQLGAFSVVVETELSGITALPWELIHWCDAAYSSCDRCSRRYYYRLSSIIYFMKHVQNSSGRGIQLNWQKHLKKKLLALFGGLSVAVAGILSIFASAFPDGLEWSILQLTGSTELPQ